MVPKLDPAQYLEMCRHHPIVFFFLVVLQLPHKSFLPFLVSKFSLGARLFKSVVARVDPAQHFRKCRHHPIVVFCCAATASQVVVVAPTPYLFDEP